jgi:CubicO group peptidase (beta-lactamase class C family)
MTRLPLLLLVAGLAACATASSELPRRAAPPSGLAALDPIVEKLIQEKKIPGAVVAVAKDGEVALMKSWGLMDVESARPMREDTIFRIYSMTKAIVTAAALALVDDGVVGLDDAVGRWIPELKDLKVQTPDGLRPPKRAPTVKDLMLHTAGFTYGGRSTGKAYADKKPLEAKDLDEMAARLADVHLAFDPGSDWQYSLSIDVLGLVVERVSGKKLDAFLQERVLGPLDMKDTGFFVPAEKADRFAANYRPEKGGLALIDDPRKSKYLSSPGLLSGGGGLVSTARDYLRFLLMVEGGGALQGRRVLSAESVRKMTADQLPREAFPIYFGQEKRHGVGFGLGFSVRTADTPWDPAGRIGEYGWGGAASTHYWASPRDRIVVVTLEQRMPYSFETEFAVKKPIYDALVK